jgi:hypothetical protein
MDDPGRMDRYKDALRSIADVRDSKLLRSYADTGVRSESAAALSAPILYLMLTARCCACRRRNRGRSPAARFGRHSGRAQQHWQHMLPQQSPPSPYIGCYSRQRRD